MKLYYCFSPTVRRCFQLGRLQENHYIPYKRAQLFPRANQVEIRGSESFECLIQSSISNVHRKLQAIAFTISFYLFTRFARVYVKDRKICRRLNPEELNQVPIGISL